MGDVFALGGRLYKFDYSRGMKAYVTEAKDSTPTIPPWFSEQLPLSYELAIEIGKFRAKFGEMVSGCIKKTKAKPLLRKGALPKEAKELLDAMPIDNNAKHSVFGYFVEQLVVCRCSTNR